MYQRIKLELFARVFCARIHVWQFAHRHNINL